MDGPDACGAERLTTRRLAEATGYSVQQVRDLERLGVIPPAARRPNGYRAFSAVHVTALRAYRRLATAVGPVAARATMREIRRLPYDEAVARVVALHVGLARSREATVSALRALDAIVGEGAAASAPDPADTMSITELSAALGLPSSTLRFWEHEGLLTPERTGSLRTRHYPPRAADDARIVAALRAGGYRIPAVRTVMASLHAAGDPTEARDALRGRLRAVAQASEALLRAGTDLADLLGGYTHESAGTPPGRAADDHPRAR